MTTKIVQRKIIHDTGQTLTLMHFPQLVWPMHCHDTCELIIMTAGSGREYIGHAVAPYRTGDITLIGCDVPHLHLCDTQDGKPDAPASTCEILYFSPALFPDNMAAVPEYAPIATMLEKSACGLRFETPGQSAHILDKIRQLACANGIARIRILLDILDTLAQIPASTIAPEPVDKKRLHKQLTVIDKVMQYLKTRYREPLTLATIAAHTGMNPSALCRHFRRHTGKTLTAVLNEIRIAHACQQLYTTNRSISAIAWESGFASQTHFNRQFRTLTGQTPGQYRKNSRSDVTA